MRQYRSTQLPSSGRIAGSDDGGSENTRYNIMQIHGLNKTTLLDYPQHLAATIFTGGCNFRCPFCHNSELVLCPVEQPLVEEEEIFRFLEKRRGIVQGVCITGGEPTLSGDLEPFIDRIREMGYPVKLDTNGYRPDVLWKLLSAGKLDYVAMDIKSSRKGYAEAAGLSGIDLSRIEESAAMLRSSSIPYEFRTTVVKGIHRAQDFEEIGRWLSGSRVYYLQSYVENENVMMPGFDSFSKEEMENFAAIARKYIDKVFLRGVE